MMAVAGAIHATSFTHSLPTRNYLVTVRVVTTFVGLPIDKLWWSFPAIALKIGMASPTAIETTVGGPWAIETYSHFSPFFISAHFGHNQTPLRLRQPLALKSSCAQLFLGPQ